MSKSIEEMEAAFEAVLAESKAIHRALGRSKSRKNIVAYYEIGERFEKLAEELREGREAAAVRERRAVREAKIAARKSAVAQLEMFYGSPV